MRLLYPSSHLSCGPVLTTRRQVERVRLELSLLFALSSGPFLVSPTLSRHSSLLHLDYNTLCTRSSKDRVRPPLLLTTGPCALTFPNRPPQHSLSVLTPRFARRLYQFLRLTHLPLDVDDAPRPRLYRRHPRSRHRLVVLPPRRAPRRRRSSVGEGARRDEQQRRGVGPKQQ